MPPGAGMCNPSNNTDQCFCAAQCRVIIFFPLFLLFVQRTRVRAQQWKERGLGGTTGRGQRRRGSLKRDQLLSLGRSHQPSHHDGDDINIFLWCFTLITCSDFRTTQVGIKREGEWKRKEPHGKKRRNVCEPNRSDATVFCRSTYTHSIRYLFSLVEEERGKYCWKDNGRNGDVRKEEKGQKRAKH